MTSGSVPVDLTVTKAKVGISGANRGATQQNELQKFKREFPFNVLTEFIENTKQQLRDSRRGGANCLGGSLKLSFPSVLNDRNQRDVIYEVILTFGDHNNAQSADNTLILAHLNTILAPKNWRATDVKRNGNNPVGAA